MLLKLVVETVVDSFVQQLLGKHGFDDDDVFFIISYSYAMCMDDND